jgi:hypothetical protein
MTRTLWFVALAILIAGCSQYRSRAQGPFAAQKKAPPPPYGALTPPPRPPSNQSPLGIASPDPLLPPVADERPLIPSKSDGVVPAGGPIPADASAGALPPLKRKPQPAPLPSPFAPKEPTNPPGITPGSPGVEQPKAAEPKAAAKDLAQIKELLATASERWKATDTLEATMTRRETSAKGGVRTDEVLLYQLRREPLALFTRNVSAAGKGREVVYNPSKHGDKLHVMLGEGDHKLFKAGFVAPPMSPDDPKVAEKARYSVRDSGFGRPIKALGAAAAKVEAGKAPVDSLTYQGGIKRNESATPMIGVTHKLRPGDDPLLPGGGTRHYFFDANRDSPSYALPVLIVATDARGQEVEYYLFSKVKSPAGLTDADFNPARLGKK